jgi:hypothetical protein
MFFVNMQTLRFRVKIQRDRGWRPTPHEDKRFWINLPNGAYFPIFQSATGLWHNSYAQHLEHSTMEKAVEDGLERRLDDGSGARRYRRIRAKERVFTLKLP